MASANPDKLSILHVDAERGFSGGEVQVMLLMEGLRARGHESALVCPPDSRFEEAAQARGFEVVGVPMHGDLDLLAVARLHRALQERGPDLVHLHTGRATWLGGLAARWSGRPAVTTRRMDRPVKRGWRTRLIYEHLVRHAVAISPAVSRRLAQAGVLPERMSTIPSAVDPARLGVERPRQAIRAELGWGPEERGVLCLASLVPRKGIDVLLEAFARLRTPRTRLLVAGEGPQREALERLRDTLGLGERARFLGPRADKAELLSACDVFCLPSRHEGLGVAVLEAMAAGRAVVATRVGGLGEAVTHEGAGLLVPPEDVEALAEALDRVLGDDGLRQRLAGEGPRRVAQGFLADQMVESYETLYRRLLSGIGETGASP